jgi:hypothetical protein
MPIRIEIDRLKEQLDATTAATLDRHNPVIVYCWDYL